MIWSESAREDLRAIHDYIALDSEFYAKKTIQDIIEQVSFLSSFPEQGRIVPELGEAQVREIFAYSYRIIYQISMTRIEVLTIVHGRRDISREDIPSSNC